MIQVNTYYSKRYVACIIVVNLTSMTLYYPLRSAYTSNKMFTKKHDDRRTPDLGVEFPQLSPATQKVSVNLDERHQLRTCLSVNSDVGGCLVVIRSFPKDMASRERIAFSMLVAGLGWSGLIMTQFVHLVRKTGKCFSVFGLDSMLSIGLSTVGMYLAKLAY
jgi:hypothetical protein